MGQGEGPGRRSLQRGRPQSESGSLQSDRACWRNPGTFLFSWVPTGPYLDPTHCLGLGQRGNTLRSKGKEPLCPLRLARPSSLLSSPPPLLAPFSSALREGGGAGCMCMYVCMYACVRAPVCMCLRVSKRMCAGAGGEVHVLTQVFDVVSLLSDRRRHVVVLFVCACL